MRYLYYENAMKHKHRIGPINKKEYRIMVDKSVDYQEWCERCLPTGSWVKDFNGNHAWFFVSKAHALYFKLVWDNKNYTL